uniref:Uncharacterized protein n=1 Tax=Glossina brevipalpis TaxID=37001 RepID=A0A1A9WK89_9MUSC
MKMKIKTRHHHHHQHHCRYVNRSLTQSTSNNHMALCVWALLAIRKYTGRCTVVSFLSGLDLRYIPFFGISCRQEVTIVVITSGVQQRKLIFNFYKTTVFSNSEQLDLPTNEPTNQPTDRPTNNFTGFCKSFESVPVNHDWWRDRESPLVCSCKAIVLHACLLACLYPHLLLASLLEIVLNFHFKSRREFNIYKRVRGKRTELDFGADLAHFTWNLRTQVHFVADIKSIEI